MLSKILVKVGDFFEKKNSLLSKVKKEVDFCLAFLVNNRTRLFLGGFINKANIIWIALKTIHWINKSK